MRPGGEIGTLYVFDHGTATIHAPGPLTISEFFVTGSDGQASILSATTIGAMDVDGTASFNANSTVEYFDNATGVVNVNADVDLIVNDQSELGTLNVVGTDATVLFKYTGDYGSATTISALTVTDGGKATVLARSVTPESDQGKARVVVVGTLDLLDGSSSPTGKLDLMDNVLILTSTSYSAVKSLLISGFNAGAWNGLGIKSTSAGSVTGTSVGYATAGDWSYSSFAGVSVSSGDVLVKYTYGGDANLDGTVDITDLSTLATNWQLSDKDWREANFNYDYPTGNPTPPNVDITDLSIIATNWQAGAGAPLRAEGDGGGSYGEFLDTIATVGLSETEAEDLLEILGTGGGETL